MDDSCEICELNNTSSCCTSWNGLGFLSTGTEKKQEVKRIHCCFIPARQASPYLRLTTNQTCSRELSVQGWVPLASATSLASFVSPEHGRAGGWTGPMWGGGCSALGALGSLCSFLLPQLCSQMMLLHKPLPSLCHSPGCGAWQEATFLPKGSSWLCRLVVTHKETCGQVVRGREMIVTSGNISYQFTDMIMPCFLLKTIKTKS